MTEKSPPSENPSQISNRDTTRFNRRDLLKLSGTGALAATTLMSGQALAQDSKEKKSLSINGVLSKASSLKNNTPLAFTYPDPDSPCVLIKMGRPVIGGVGPDTDIVAFSILCSHRGCPVNYHPDNKTFQCPCHFSIFDGEKNGQQVCGQATVNLPSIVLNYDEKTDNVSAVGVNGLIYGRINNQLYDEQSEIK